MECKLCVRDVMINVIVSWRSCWEGGVNKQKLTVTVSTTAVQGRKQEQMISSFFFVPNPVVDALLVDRDGLRYTGKFCLSD